MEQRRPCRAEWRRRERTCEPAKELEGPTRISAPPQPSEAPLLAGAMALSRPLKGLLSDLSWSLKLEAWVDPSRGCCREAASSKSPCWHALHPAREHEHANTAAAHNLAHATCLVVMISLSMTIRTGTGLLQSAREACLLRKASTAELRACPAITAARSSSAPSGSISGGGLAKT